MEVAVCRWLSGQSPLSGEKTGRNPTDRGKPGTKKSIVVEADGGPLGIVIAPANVHDTKCLEETLEAIVVERPEEPVQHLCLDKGYDNPTGRKAAENADYRHHIRRIGEEKPKTTQRRYKARRWVVERTISWLQKCRAILVRYDKNAQNYLGLLQLACALLWFRRLHRLRAF